MNKIKIEKENEKERLDKFLAHKLKKYSRSQIQKMIKEGLVLVNEEIKTPHYFLYENDIIHIKKVENKPPKSQFKISDIEIIFNSKDFVVVNKPAGLIVHGAKHIKEKTLAELKH